MENRISQYQDDDDGREFAGFEDLLPEMMGEVKKIDEQLKTGYFAGINAKTMAERFLWLFPAKGCIVNISDNRKSALITS